ncbi:MAG: phosphoribosylpyrophosphate synthetase, partial [Gammaproteobacteria bacterium]|nr:phosphoribosylpyrophosphate synthetase [Gammaproteobacteria bacterium]
DSAALDYTICHKTRHGDHDVDVHLGDCDLADKDVVIIDDIASTGQTLATAARNAQSAGVASISCMVTHSLLDSKGEQSLRNSGVKQIWSSDSISHPSNAIQLAELLATAL